MEILKVISILLPVMVALSGAGLYLFNIYQEPNFEDGQYFTTAWIEYGVNQNTLSIEFKPDLQGSAYAAVGEVLKRVYEKKWINARIDSKPIILNMYARDKLDLVLLGRATITMQELDTLSKANLTEKQKITRLLSERAEANESIDHVHIEIDGHLVIVPINNTTKSPTRLVEEYIKARPGGVAYAR